MPKKSISVAQEVARNGATLQRVQSYRSVKAYRTKDGSAIRELMHPSAHGNHAQSLAEAIVPAGKRTLLHRHHTTEEIYHVTAGRGRMTLGDDRFPVAQGDTVCISPGMAHCIEAIGPTPLRILCCCAPAYAHEDTELLEADPGDTLLSAPDVDSAPEDLPWRTTDACVQPALIVQNGDQAKALRVRLGLRQKTFWRPVLVVQSASSRYECGRAIPDQVCLLLHLVYGSEVEAEALLSYLRDTHAFSERGLNGFPLLDVSEGKLVKALRNDLGLSQAKFWKGVQMTQSGGCRYERGRAMPAQVPELLHLVYGSEEQAQDRLAQLRVKSA